MIRHVQAPPQSGHVAASTGPPAHGSRTAALRDTATRTTPARPRDWPTFTVGLAVDPRRRAGHHAFDVTSAPSSFSALGIWLDDVVGDDDAMSMASLFSPWAPVGVPASGRLVLPNGSQAVPGVAFNERVRVRASLTGISIRPRRPSRQVSRGGQRPIDPARKPLVGVGPIRCVPCRGLEPVTQLAATIRAGVHECSWVTRAPPLIKSPGSSSLVKMPCLMKNDMGLRIARRAETSLPGSASTLLRSPVIDPSPASR